MFVKIKNYWYLVVICSLLGSASIVASPTRQENYDRILELLVFAKENNAESKQQAKYMVNKLQNAQSATDLRVAWKPILETLNSAFWVSRDNTKKFHAVAPHIDNVDAVLIMAVQDLDGKLQNDHALAVEVAQLHFKVANWHSLAISTKDPRHKAKCLNCLNKTETFIHKNGLDNSKEHAVLHNLLGGELSRQYQRGEVQLHPAESVQHFREAVRIQEGLGNTVQNPDSVHLRHVMLCLGSTIVQQAFSEMLSDWQAITAKKDQLQKLQAIGASVSDVNKLQTEIAIMTRAAVAKMLASTDEAEEIFAKLPDSVLIIPNKQTTPKPDLYRRADRDQYSAYIYLLRGDSRKAVDSAMHAERQMQESLVDTGATGQLSSVRNTLSEVLIAHATLNTLASIEASENNFEQMYADAAKRDLQASEKLRGMQLAQAIYGYLPVLQQ